MMTMFPGSYPRVESILSYETELSVGLIFSKTIGMPSTGHVIGMSSSCRSDLVNVNLIPRFLAEALSPEYVASMDFRLSMILSCFKNIYMKKHLTFQ